MPLPPILLPLFHGYDFTKTDSIAARFKNILKGIKGTADINISRADYQPEYQVDFDREKLAIYGLNLQTAANALRNRINIFHPEGEYLKGLVLYVE